MKESRVIELNRMIAIEAKLDALMNKLGNQERRMHPAHELRTVEESEQKSSAKEGLANKGPYQVEEAQFVNGNKSYNFKPNLNLPSHYTPALRNHENFSYGGGAQQGCAEFSTTICFTRVPRIAAARESESKKSRTKEILIL